MADPLVRMINCRRSRMLLMFVVASSMIGSARQTVAQGTPRGERLQNAGKTSIEATSTGKDEIQIQSKLVSMSLFKNGLAVVQREVSVDKAGTYRLDEVPTPVHGTLLLSGWATTARVETRSIVETSVEQVGEDLQQELAGLDVAIRFKGEGGGVVGRVAEFDPLPPLDMNLAVTRSASGTRFLVLTTGSGVTYVDPAEIRSIEIKGQPRQVESKVVVDKPVLILQCPSPTGGRAMISYLTHGISWAPSYHIDLLDAKRLRIEQQAVIRNELVDFKEISLSLISGYPSVQFGNVTSPFAAQQTWDSFFRQLGQRGGVQYLNNAIMLQNQAFNASAMDPNAAASVVAPNVGDTLDLNYRDVGKHSLTKGASMMLKADQAEADYERIVEWTIRDNRDEWGTPHGENRVYDPNTGDVLQDDVWDALKLKNRMQHPWTTGPVMVTTDGKFKGQSQLNWTNAGESTTVRVNKALSIRARHVEFEKASNVPEFADREVIYLAGRRFRKVLVAGELRLGNYRPTEIKLLAKRQFSGDYLRGDDSPQITLREEGVWSLNKRSELTWTLDLKPNEERTVKYEYAVLVPF